MRHPGRREILVGAGAVGFAGLLAGCGPRAGTDTPADRQDSGDDPALRALLADAPACPATAEETGGPYWFDVDDIRSDIREDRTGVPLELMLRVIDLDTCSAGGDGDPVRDAVVEIWHCDAEGVYSGFEEASHQAGSGPPPPPPDGGGFPGPPPGPGGAPSDGSYSVGDRQSPRTDDSTYLRGAQVTDSAGIVRFTSIYPGWYHGRTVHIHLRVHLNKRLVRTTQLYFDDTLNDAVFTTAEPYTAHRGRDTRNDTDGIYDPSGLLAQRAQPGPDHPTRVLAALNIGVRPR
ncbi:hypothetical protein BHQ15_02815 [Mycolicibacillus koreensis]|nr:hypothetical protein BHQ15_02815 [Mycolicibacillus koreensis]